MIDIHSHILFDLDDGAQSLQESLSMARAAVHDGIRCMVATPHSPDSVVGERYDPELVRERLAVLRASLAAERIPLEVIEGTELHYGANLAERLARGTLMAYAGGRAVLLELPNEYIPPSLDATICQLQTAGYRIVFAHPERYHAVQHNPEWLVPFIERGVLMQITAEALTGLQGDRMRRSAEALVVARMAHVVASDTHGDPPRRAASLSAAYEHVAGLIGRADARAMVEATPAAILAGDPVAVPVPHVNRRTRATR